MRESPPPAACSAGPQNRWRSVWVRLAVAVIATGAVSGMALVGGARVLADGSPAPATLSFRVVMPELVRAARPGPFIGPIVALDIPSIGVDSRWPVEERATRMEGGIAFMEDPSAPNRIAWYPEYGRPGFGGGNTIFAAHVNYVGWSVTPFARIQSLRVDDSIYLTMADGTVYAYSVKKVDLVRTEDLDMGQLLRPSLDSHTERVTLISCGGEFFYNPGVGGDYRSRIIVIADRYVPDQ